MHLKGLFSFNLQFKSTSQWQLAVIESFFNELSTYPSMHSSRMFSGSAQFKYPWFTFKIVKSGSEKN